MTIWIVLGVLASLAACMGLALAFVWACIKLEQMHD